DPLPNGVGEAQDPLEQARQMAEITAQNRPPGGQQEGQPGGNQQERRSLTLTTPEDKDAWLREMKQRNLAYLPTLMEMLQAMARPMLEQDLEGYLQQQREGGRTGPRGG